MNPGVPITFTDHVTRLLQHNCVVAIGVSGGKDSVACALAVNKKLKEMGHRGPKLLIHSDLGRVEWKDSLPSCERVAEKIGWELVTVRRKAGDMLARWQGRWKNNLSRYKDLLCVKLILPWSTPSMRFCTSELKTDVICAELKKRFTNQHIISVTGIRRQESATRARMPVSDVQKKLQRNGYAGVTWNAIIDATTDQVFAEIANSGLKLHEAYTRYNSSRVSCAFCIMGSAGDLAAASSCIDNQAVYVPMCELEIVSTFSFQDNKWLSDVAPHLLPAELRECIALAKEKAKQREAIEATIPAHLLYVKGWPTVMPTPGEAELLASVRQRISALIGIEANYLTAESVANRYAELMEEKSRKANAKRQRSSSFVEAPQDDTLKEMADECPGCICPRECDCENPEPTSGAALLSNECPIHNWDPFITEGCPAERHYMRLERTI